MGCDIIQIIIYRLFTRMKIILALVIVVPLLLAKPIYNHVKSYVIRLTDFNFDDQIKKYRHSTKYVNFVQFYKSNDGKSSQFAKQFDQWTNQYNGIFRIGAIDCQLYQKVCNKQGVTTYPTFRVYPLLPLPTTDYDGQLNTQNITKFLSKFMSNNAIEITNGNIQTFLSQSPSVPKVLLFTDKKGFPLIYKGLSVAFQKKLLFGAIRSSDQLLMDKYNVKILPTVLVLKPGVKKPIVYQGKFKFGDMFDFLNIYSEVYVPGGGSSMDLAATKKWLTDVFPQLHMKSSNDICLKAQNTLCIIYVTKQKVSQEKIKMFEALNIRYDRKIERGFKFKFMYLNANKEEEWAKMFNYEGNDKLVILNPGKRKRYSVHQEQLTKQAIVNTLQKVLGGDAHFNRLTKLPFFSSRLDI